MRASVDNLFVAGAAVLVLGWAVQAAAQTSDEGVIPLSAVSGKETCESILINHGPVAEFTDTTIALDTVETHFVGPSEVEVTVTLESGIHNLSFEVVSGPGLNCVVAKGGPRGGNIYLYVPNGEDMDGGLAASGSTITQYSLGVLTDPIIDDTPLAECPADCALSSPSSVRVEWLIDAPNEITACGCNLPPGSFPTCNPAEDDPPGSVPNACFPCVENEFGEVECQKTIKGLEGAGFVNTPLCFWTTSDGGGGKTAEYRCF